MLILLSPAKALDFEPRGVEMETTRPVLMERTRILSKTTAGLTAPKLKQLMGLSEDLAVLNRERFKAFDPESANGRPAAMVTQTPMSPRCRDRLLHSEFVLEHRKGEKQRKT